MGRGHGQGPKISHPRLRSRTKPRNLKTATTNTTARETATAPHEKSSRFFFRGCGRSRSNSLGAPFFLLRKSTKFSVIRKKKT